MRKVMIVLGTLVLCTLIGIKLGAITSATAIENHHSHSCMDMSGLFIWIFYQIGLSIAGLGAGIFLSPVAIHVDIAVQYRREENQRINAQSEPADILLRSFTGSSRYTLLRAAQGVTTTKPHQLLRPSEENFDEPAK